MTEIVLLLWLGDVARSVTLLAGLLLVVGLKVGACMAVLVAVDDAGYVPPRGLVSSAVLSIAILALVLSVMPSRRTIHLYAAACAVQVVGETELGREVYAALLRTLREVSPAK